MDDDELQRSLLTHIQQVHAAERAQASELRALRGEVGIAAIAALLDQHLAETIHHGDLLGARLEELGQGRSMRLLLQSFGAVAPKLVLDRVRPHDARACVRDAVAAEAGEIASYLLLGTEAIRAGDDDTAVLAAEIRADEVRTRDELMSNWNLVVDHDLEAKLESAGTSATRVAQTELLNHLQDVHALERNATIMLSTVLATVRDETAVARVDDHRQTTERHVAEIADRLDELGSGRSLRRQAQGYAFAALKGPINLVRAEKAGKDFRDMYVVEQLKTVAYRQLEVLADRAGDERTAAIAVTHLSEEHGMVRWLEREVARFLLESTLGRSAPR
ncbi:MAG: hypothetical protein JWM90_1585 [Thermoleophilia bacterium]|nr:hypothetical protein [Thermoleophilia bacterium]